MDCNPPGSSVHGDCRGKNTEGGLSCPPLGDLPNPGIEPRPHCRRALPAEPPGKPKNTSGSPIPSPGELPDPGVEPGSLVLQADSLLAELPGKL